MKNMKHKKPHLILPKPISPIMGFILQKDVYTTNLLYANDQFPTRSLRKTIPFIKKPWMKDVNPSSCITITREKNSILEKNSEFILDKNFLFKHKKLRGRKLKFPLPKMKTVALSNSILQEEICKDDVTIKYLKDDGNITSTPGKKFKYTLKSKTNRYLKKNDFSVSFNNTSQSNNSLKLNLNDESEKQKYNSPLKTYTGDKKRINDRKIKLSKIHSKNIIKNIITKNFYELKKDICRINDDLRRFNLNEKERKRSFFKKDFFPTQIYTKIKKKKGLKH